MNTVATLIWLVVIVFDTFGQLSFKAAAATDEGLDGWARWKAMLSDKWIWVGIGSYVVEFFAWLAFLSMVPLSLAVLVGSINIITVVLAGRVFFGEALTRKRVAATILITLGVVLVGWA